MTLDGTPTMVACGVCALIMLISAGCSRAATAASNYPAGSKDIEQRAEAYGKWLGWLRNLLLLVASSGVVAYYLEAEMPPAVLYGAMGWLGVIDLVSCQMGMRGAGRLLESFQQQRAKAGKKE